MRCLIGFVCLVLTYGCGPTLDLGPPTSGGGPSVIVEPVGTLARAPSVLRLRVSDGLGRSDLADFRLFTGALSAYHRGRLGQRDLPKTLLERELPRAVWVEGADVIVAPALAVAPGTVTLASPDLGVLAEVNVDPALVPWLPRRWPPAEQSTGRGAMIFCGPGASGIAATDVLLEPARVVATVRPGLGGESVLERDCLRLEPHDAVLEGALLVPPAVVDGVGLEPRPLVVGSALDPAGACAPFEMALGPGCAVVEDDRVRIRARGAASFWLVREPEERLSGLAPDQSIVIRGLEPGRATRFAATVFDLEGSSEQLDVELLAAEATSHVVINEVLANPVGAERTSEWIELVNDGRVSVDLGGWELRDTTGASVMPEVELEPGELAVVVARGFAPDPELDVVVPPSVKRLEVSALGSGGLTNGGEPLRLVDAEGRVLSRFPAIAAPRPGQSVARVAPDAADTEAGSFALHAAPGASPGAPNLTEP